jgi:hypothetical protein
MGSDNLYRHQLECEIDNLVVGLTLERNAFLRLEMTSPEYQMMRFEIVLYQAAAVLGRSDHRELRQEEVHLECAFDEEL